MTKKLIENTGIDSSYHIDFSTVKQLIQKLSSDTIKEWLRNGLEDVKLKDRDCYNTNNYLLTLRQLLNIARSHVDEELDTRALDSFSYRKLGSQGYRTQEVQINRNQFSTLPRKGGHGNMNNHNKDKNNYRKRSRSSDDDDDSKNYHINEFGYKVY